MAAILYAARGSFLAHTSDLYTVNPTTAAVTSIGFLGYGITGLAADPTDADALYAVTSPQSTFSPRHLLKISLATLFVTDVGALGGTVADIAFNSTGQLYGWKPDTANCLTLINKTTAACTDKAAVGFRTNGCGISFNSANQLFLSPNGSDGTFYSVDPATGAATSLGDFSSGLLVSNTISAFSFDSNDVLYGICISTPSVLFTVGTPSGGLVPTTQLGAFPSGGWDALAWHGTRSVGGGGGSGHTLVRTPPWRFIVTDLDHKTLTFFDNVALNRHVEYTLNAPAMSTGRVPSDFPEVSLHHTDGDPFLAEGNRFLIGFTREGGSPPWKVRFAGIIHQINDVVESDQPYSDYTAFDPWAYLNHVPCLKANGTLPGEEGLIFVNQRGSDIVSALLNRLRSFNHGRAGNIFLDWGWSAHYGGTFENTDRIDFPIQQGKTVGEAFSDLTSGNTIDIVLTPIYSPVLRKGVLSEVSVYKHAGKVRNDAVMSWDLPGRALTSIDRMEDGTKRANYVQYFRSNNIAPGPAVDTASVTKFGDYWALQTFPNDYPATVIAKLEKAQLLRDKTRESSVIIDIIPEISPVPFVDYFVGDDVPIYASRRLRKPISIKGRVYTLPIDIDDNGVTQVTQLEFTTESIT